MKLCSLVELIEGNPPSSIITVFLRRGRRVPPFQNGEPITQLYLPPNIRRLLMARYQVIHSQRKSQIQSLRDWQRIFKLNATRFSLSFERRNMITFFAFFCPSWYYRSYSSFQANPMDVSIKINSNYYCAIMWPWNHKVMKINEMLSCINPLVLIFIRYIRIFFGWLSLSLSSAAFRHIYQLSCPMISHHSDPLWPQIILDGVEQLSDCINVNRYILVVGAEQVI